MSCINTLIWCNVSKPLSYMRSSALSSSLNENDCLLISDMSHISLRRDSKLMCVDNIFLGPITISTASRRYFAMAVGNSISPGKNQRIPFIPLINGLVKQS